MLWPKAKARGRGGSCRREGQAHRAQVSAIVGFRKSFGQHPPPPGFPPNDPVGARTSAAVRPRGPAGVADTALSCLASWSLAREMVKRAGTSAIPSI